MTIHNKTWLNTQYLRIWFGNQHSQKLDKLVGAVTQRDFRLIGNTENLPQFFINTALGSMGIQMNRCLLCQIRPFRQ